VLAVGIAQLTPPERVAPTVTDMAAAPGEARKDDTLQAAAKDATVAAAPASALPPPEVAPAMPAPGMGAGASATERGPVPALKVPKPVAEARPQGVAQDKLARGAPEMAAATSVASLPAAPAPSARPLSEPFPAAGKAESRRDAKLEEASPAVNAPPRQAVEPVLAQSRVAARAASADNAKLTPSPARAVDDWIKRIRDLKNAGRLDEAAKELAAFRSAYGERADALLPEDLRQIKP
jgi:hypothetical protein